VSTALRFLFESFELDPARRRLTNSGQPVGVSDRQLEVLLLLVVRAGQIVAKEDLLDAGWKDVAVGDNSLEQAISTLRKIVGARCIETVARRGYRFTAAVTRSAARESDTALDALLAPHRAFTEGRAALESLESTQIAHAREVFEGTLRSVPEHPSAHIGLANACAMQFEITRTDPAPDREALRLAVQHAREACRLDPQSAEAWATLGFVLDRHGDRVDALAASKRAVTLEPLNWRHHFRLSFVSWGEERLSAAQRTLSLLPHFPLAHWLAATVHVARQAFDEAERELTAALAVHEEPPPATTRFSGVALHWLLGLIHLARGDETRALQELDRELQSEHAGHLYARECAANTWYALGALRLRQRRAAEAAAAFHQAIERVSTHPMARIGLAAVSASRDDSCSGDGRDGTTDGRLLAPVDVALPLAAHRAIVGDHDGAARLIDDVLTTSPPGNAGWLVPIEPLLHVAAHPEAWGRVLAHLRTRAA
jgi:DNA-binding winged helix-turn-helix (wHTH) protein